MPRLVFFLKHKSIVKGLDFVLVPSDSVVDNPEIFIPSFALYIVIPRQMSDSEVDIKKTIFILEHSFACRAIGTVWMGKSCCGLV